MTSFNSQPFAALADHLINARSAAGLTQTDLAKALTLKQQSVSRWEAGTHRPARELIPALAQLLEGDEAELLTLADYAEIPSATAKPPFPIEFLTPEMFEQFTADLLRMTYPDAEVQQQGARGHDQGGTDILATFPDGKVWSFQCKRVERFGPAEVRKAIQYHSVAHDRAFLVLSRTASPAAIAAAAEFPNWTLWDKQDLGGMIRQLAPNQQDKLVDMYFNGQRMALLGRSQPGPWLTLDEYFAPFSGRAVALSHDWELGGRTEEMTELASALNDNVPVMLLTGAGGIGKTRLLKQAVERFASQHKAITVRFLSLGGEPDRAGVEALGNRTKLLVIDDAHDRESLTGLIEYAVDARNKARLLIASRPYAEQRIRNQLALFNITAPRSLRLEPLGKADLRPLVEEVLTEFGGDKSWADAVLEVAQNSPLVAAMAARIIARDGIPLELARKETEFRRLALAKFTGVITGNLGGSISPETIRQTLEILALIQPFRADESAIAALVSAVRSSIDADEAGRILKLLVDGGVLYKRGALYRLMPDLLSDFLIESSCVGIDGKLTDFATRVAHEVDDRQLAQVLVNLGRMDWRLQDGDPSGSPLLAPLWTELRKIDDKYDPRLEAVKAVAIYQPAQALEFIQSQLDAGRQFHNFGPILRQIAFAAEHRQDALRLLWDLGCNDQRNTNSNTDHPLRILTDLIDYGEDKPLEFIKDIADFAFKLLDDPSAWQSHYSPFDVLRPLLKGEGTNTHWHKHAISFEPYFVTYDLVAPLRSRVVQSALDRLTSPDAPTAYRSALFLNDALRGPYGLMNATAPEEEVAKFDREFLETIIRIGEIIRTGVLLPTTILGLISSLQWFADYHEGDLGEAVRAIFADLPQATDFRLYAALSEGADYRYVGQVPFSDWEEDRDWMVAFADEVVKHYPDLNELCQIISNHLSCLDTAGVGTGGNGRFIEAIINARPEFARMLMHTVEANSASRLQHYLGYGLGALLDREPANGRKAVITFLASSDAVLRHGAMRALIGVRRSYDDEDLDILRLGLTSDDTRVVDIAITALRTWQDIPTRQMTDLALLVRYDLNPVLLNAVAMLLCNRHHKAVAHLTPPDVAILLDRMACIPKLEGHWTDELLQRIAAKYPDEFVAFILRRADKTMDPQHLERFDAVSYSHRQNTFNLHDSANATYLLKEVWAWLRSKDGNHGIDYYYASQIFGALFEIDSDIVIAFFEGLLERATPADLRWIARVIRHGEYTFTLRFPEFVQKYLACCRDAGADILEEAISLIEAAAFSGSWSGISGEPMPRDIETQQRTKEIVSSLSRLSPAYRLYKDILESSSRKIEQSIRDREALDADE